VKSFHRKNVVILVGTRVNLLPHKERPPHIIWHQSPLVANNHRTQSLTSKICPPHHFNMCAFECLLNILPTEPFSSGWITTDDLDWPQPGRDSSDQMTLQSSKLQLTCSNAHRNRASTFSGRNLGFSAGTKVPKPTSERRCRNIQCSEITRPPLFWSRPTADVAF